jgi:HD-like signal output (HDOD) protein
MPRILFVDDEPMILSSMRSRLSRRRPDWDCSYVESGAEALDVLASLGDVNVVVTDMRMPQMDGATLLTIVRERHPKAFRIVLSGQMNRDAQLRALPVTHRFLAKPCPPAEIEATIEQALAIQTRIENPAVADLVGGIHHLPSSPPLVQELNRLIADPTVGVNRIASVIDRDPAMAARLLHVANSAFFGLRRQIRTSLEAINWLGVDLVRKLTLTCEVSMVAARAGVSAARIKELQTHALLAARIASRLVKQEDAATAATAALLHNVGAYLFALAPAPQREAVEAAMAEGLSENEAHRRVFGCLHGEAGAHLLNLWGLPLEIVRAVALHQDPKEAFASGTITEVGAVHLADLLARVAARWSPHPPPASALGIDPALVERLGIADRLLEWSLLANKQQTEMLESAA